jgi:hypothetical protein
MVEGPGANRQPQKAPASSQRKKAAPEGAAKFREETPRKGERSRKRDTALQQYATPLQHHQAENLSLVEFMS